MAERFSLSRRIFDMISLSKVILTSQSATVEAGRFLSQTIGFGIIEGAMGGGLAVCESRGGGGGIYSHPYPYCAPASLAENAATAAPTVKYHPRRCIAAHLQTLAASDDKR
jgi:hypothetical protein